MKHNLTKKISFDALSILKYLPGYICCMDLENRFNYYVNDQCAHINGYDNVDEIYETKMDAIPCKAAEYALTWAEQNQLVVKTYKSIKTLDIHPYRNNDVKILLGHKNPFFDDNGNAIATLFHGIEVNQNNLTEFLMNIAKSDKKYQIANNINHRSYYIGHPLKDFGLTNREIECLFYMVRGKTASQIAKILFISKRTVETHIVHMKSKLGCATKSDLIAMAVEHNLINVLPEIILNNLHSGISMLI